MTRPSWRTAAVAQWVSVMPRTIMSPVVYRPPLYTPTDSASQRAVRRSRPSPWRGPTSCTPSGRPLAPWSSGRLTEGRPSMVQSVQKVGSPGGLEPRRRRPIHGRRQDRVVALLEELGERGHERARRRLRGQVLGGPHRVAVLDPCAQWRRQPVAPRLPLAPQVDRQLRVHDHAVPLGQLVGARGQLELLHAPAQMLDHLSERRLRVLGDAIPPPRSGRTRSAARSAAPPSPPSGMAPGPAGACRGRARRTPPPPRAAGPDPRPSARRVRRGRGCARAGTCRAATPAHEWA